MNIVVIGGSNSLLKEGYLTHLAQALPAARIRQLSVGATSTLAAIGRLFDTAGEQEPDVILYEYSINDAGHFAWRPDGDRSWMLAFHLLVKAAVRLYPNAVLVPLVFAMRRSAPLSLHDPFYDLQINTFAALRLPFIDMRSWLGQRFAGDPPAWLYGDEAHYSAPDATAMIGNEVARRLAARDDEMETLSVTWQRMQQLSPHGAFDMFYVPAANLLQFVTGPAEPGQDGNRLMQLSYLRMHAGSRLAMRTEMFPLALYLKSDAGHDSVRVSVDSEAVRGSVVTGTRHADTDSCRFICSNLPLPLLFGSTLAMPFGPAAFELHVEDDRPPATTNFDCFGRGGVHGAQYLDLCAILFVAPATT